MARVFITGSSDGQVYLKIGGRMVYLWRAVDAEGEVLDVLVQSKRNKHAALKLMRKLLKRYAFAPERLVTDNSARSPQGSPREPCSTSLPPSRCSTSTSRPPTGAR